jgi:hypothetical protein
MGKIAMGKIAMGNIAMGKIAMGKFAMGKIAGCRHPFVFDCISSDRHGCIRAPHSRAITYSCNETV